jgi:DMSO/TMAO reductase YedYZ molybdopterin-dependent catalytic subunit
MTSSVATHPPADAPLVPVRGGHTWWARLAGAIAGLAAIGVSDLVSWVVAPAASVIPAVGELIIGLLPGPLVNWGKSTLGTADKPFLLIVIFLAVLAVCSLAGQLELRRTYAGGTVFAGLAVVGVLALAVSGDVPGRGYVVPLVGLVAGFLVLNVLVERLRSWRAGGTAGGTGSAARRRFLGFTIGAGALAAAVAVAGRLMINAAGAVADARDRFRLPAATRPAPAVPAGAELGAPGLTPYVTPNAEFYRIDTALQVPVVNPDDWSLKVTGLVEREVTLTLAELSARPLVEHYATLTCVSNEVGGDLAGNALWLGYPIRELLAQARPRAGADMVLSTSSDGWTAGTPLAALTDPGREALLAIGMNGEPLPLEHGFPVRMVVPGLYGYVSATKWVTELKVTTFAEDQGYWTPLGWSALGPIKIASRIDTPRRSVPAGPVAVAGVAWAQHTGIARVEVRIDGAAWREATLAETAGPDTWRQWKLDWDAPAGEHELSVRATGADGVLQTEEYAPPEPDGATSWHTISVRVT